MRIKIIDEKEREKWNEVVEKSNYGTAYALYEWQKVLINSYKNLKFIGFMGVENGRPLVIYPTFQESTKVPFLKTSRSIPLSGFGGPIVRTDIPSESQQKILDKIIKEIDNYLKRKNLHNYVLLTPWNEKHAMERLTNNGYEIVSNEMSAYLDISRSMDIIWKGYTKNCRVAINQGRKRGASIREIENRDDLLECFKLYKETMARSGKPPKFNITSFYESYNLMVKNGYGKFYLAEYNNKIIGVLFILAHKDHMIYWIGASTSDKELRKLRSQNLLLDEAIQWGHEQGYKHFDLGGTGVNGLKLFKLSWGSELVNTFFLKKTYYLMLEKSCKIGKRIIRHIV